METEKPKAIAVLKEGDKRVQQQEPEPDEVEAESEVKIPEVVFEETFQDVIGNKKAKELLATYVGLALSEKELFKTYAKKRTLGLIFYGPPGTGKTLLVRALSGQYKIPVIIADIGKTISSYVGESSKNITALFERARKAAPCILVMDEFDSLGFKKENPKQQSDSATKNMQDAINQLQIEMDGINSRAEDVFVIGLTNRPWNIESTIKRSGRFEMSVYISPPDYFSRMKLFKYYLKDVEHGKTDVIMERLARATIDYSPADIKRVCDSAKMIAIKKAHETGRKGKITTRTLLKVLRDRELGRSSLPDFYNSVTKDVLPRFSDDDIELYGLFIKDLKFRKKIEPFRKAIQLFSVWVS